MKERKGLFGLLEARGQGAEEKEGEICKKESVSLQEIDLRPFFIEYAIFSVSGKKRGRKWFL